MSLNNLATFLAKVGRREEALQAAQEAADLYRRLADATPQAFEPDLARSLGTLGAVLLGLGRAPEAAETFAEGARRLLPHARALPQAFGSLFAWLVQEYLRACQAGDIPPDETLLQEIASAFIFETLAPLARLAPLLLGVVAVAQGQGDADLAAQVQGALGQMQQTKDWQALATALLRLLDGERDPQALTAGLELDEVDAQALALALAAISSEEGLLVLAALAQGGAGE